MCYLLAVLIMKVLIFALRVSQATSLYSETCICIQRPPLFKDHVVMSEHFNLIKRPLFLGPDMVA
jgi:hypothetical protein